MSWFSTLFSKAKAEAKTIESDLVDDYHAILADVRAELPVLHGKIDGLESDVVSQFTHLISYAKSLEARVVALETAATTAASAIKGS